MNENAPTELVVPEAEDMLRLPGEVEAGFEPNP